VSGPIIDIRAMTNANAGDLARLDAEASIDPWPPEAFRRCARDRSAQPLVAMVDGRLAAYLTAKKTKPATPTAAAPQGRR
jgi:hypothetical protein